MTLSEKNDDKCSRYADAVDDACDASHRRHRPKIIEFPAHCSPLCIQEYILMMRPLMRSTNTNMIFTQTLLNRPYTGFLN